MNISDIEYPLRLCVETIHYCIISNPVTEDKRFSEIQESLYEIFGKEMVDKANAILQGQSYE